MAATLTTDVVLFDIDGTLIDSVDAHAEAWQRAFRQFGRELPFDRIRSQIGKGSDQFLPGLISKAEIERFGGELEAYRLDLYMREYVPRLRAFPGVRPLFERLKADGKRIALASSAKGEELEAYRKLLGVDDLVDGLSSSVDAERSKPHPDIFNAALDRLGGRIDPARAIVVGDTPYDAQAASRASLRTIGLLCGGFPAEELRHAGCIALYRDPADLLARYDESPLKSE